MNLQGDNILTYTVLWISHKFLHDLVIGHKSEGNSGVQSFACNKCLMIKQTCRSPLPHRFSHIHTDSLER